MWHGNRAYTHFKRPDAEALKGVKEFNKFDLDSKDDALLDVEVLHTYFTCLLLKRNIAGKLKWRIWQSCLLSCLVGFSYAMLCHVMFAPALQGEKATWHWLNGLRCSLDQCFKAQPSVTAPDT